MLDFAVNNLSRDRWRAANDINLYIDCFWLMTKHVYNTGRRIYNAGCHTSARA